MTHEELLAKIKTGKEFSGEVGRVGWDALRAVVKLHKPFEVNDILLCECEPIVYPCPTIQAIEKELNA